jgi:hypothetical protein
MDDGCGALKISCWRAATDTQEISESLHSRRSLQVSHAGDGIHFDEIARSDQHVEQALQLSAGLEDDRSAPGAAMTHHASIGQDAHTSFGWASSC